jgi:hypothetical protein
MGWNFKRSVSRDFRLLYLHKVGLLPLHSSWHGVDYDLEASAVGRFQHSEDIYMLYLVTKENLCIVESGT